VTDSLSKFWEGWPIRCGGRVHDRLFFKCLAAVRSVTSGLRSHPLCIVQVLGEDIQSIELGSWLPIYSAGRAFRRCFVRVCRAGFSCLTLTSYLPPKVRSYTVKDCFASNYSYNHTGKFLTSLSARLRRYRCRLAPIILSTEKT
jgi:hypothetical protein